MSKNKVELLVKKNALREVPLDKIQTDHSYQRALNPVAVRKIEKDYNPVALGVPLVGERTDGTLWIVDGQQRVGALRKMGRHKHLRCEVFASNGPEHEAEVFRLVNKNRTAIKPIDLFCAMLVAGDESCLEIKRITEDHGFKIPKRAIEGEGTTAALSDGSTFWCVAALGKVYRQSGGAGLKFIFSTLKQVWPDDPDRCRDTMVLGLHKFWLDHEQVVDMERLLARLEKTTPQKILYSANMGVGDRATNVAAVFAQLYRKRKA